MTTLQARNWAHVARHSNKARDYSKVWAAARTALGFALIGVLLFAALALRAYMFVHLS